MDSGQATAKEAADRKPFGEYPYVNKEVVADYAYVKTTADQANHMFRIHLNVPCTAAQAQALAAALGAADLSTARTLAGALLKGDIDENHKRARLVIEAALS